MTSAVGCISAEWNGPDTGSIIARRTPLALAISTARSTAALWPDTTTCPPPLSFAACTDLPLRGLGGDRCRLLELDPEQRRHGADADRHRLLHGTAADAHQPHRIGERERAAAASAAYSPTEWPATNLASRARSTPASVSSTRRTASDTATSAGCAFSVSVTLSAGPSHITVLSLSPSAASTSSNTCRAAAKGLGQRLAHADRLAALPGKHERRRHVGTFYEFRR